MTWIIATTGMIGSGKDAVADLLADQFSAVKINISDIVRKEAIAAGVSLDRSSLTDFSTAQLERFSATYFVDKAISDIENTPGAVFLISGIRTRDDVVQMRARFGNHFVLIAIEVSNDAIRFRRIRDRGDSDDRITDRELAKNDAIQECRYMISETVNMSDFRWENSGPLSDLHQLIREMSLAIPELTDYL